LRFVSDASVLILPGNVATVLFSPIRGEYLSEAPGAKGRGFRERRGGGYVAKALILFEPPLHGEEQDREERT